MHVKRGSETASANLVSFTKKEEIFTSITGFVSVFRKVFIENETVYEKKFQSLGGGLGESFRVGLRKEMVVAALTTEHAQGLVLHAVGDC